MLHLKCINRRNLHRNKNVLSHLDKLIVINFKEICQGHA